MLILDWSVEKIVRRLHPADEKEPDPNYEPNVVDACFTHDGQRIVTLHGNLCVRLWDISSGKQLMSFHIGNKVVNGPRFSPHCFSLSADDQMIVIGYGAPTGAHLLVTSTRDLKSGKELARYKAFVWPRSGQYAAESAYLTVPPLLTSHEKPLMCLICNDAIFLVDATTGRELTHIYDYKEAPRIVASGRESVLWKGGEIEDAMISPDGSQILVFDRNDDTSRVLSRRLSHWTIANAESKRSNAPSFRGLALNLAEFPFSRSSDGSRFIANQRQFGLSKIRENTVKPDGGQNEKALTEGRERSARAALNGAALFAGRPDKMKQIYQGVIDRYPGTKAASEAKKRLEKLK